MCFVADPMKRATFSDIVEELEQELYDTEKQEYSRKSEQYASMSSLIFDPNTQLKRSSINRNVGKLADPSSPDISDASYLKMSRIDSQENTHLNLGKPKSHIELDNNLPESDGLHIHKSTGNVAIPKQEILSNTNTGVNKSDQSSKTVDKLAPSDDQIATISYQKPINFNTLNDNAVQQPNAQEEPVISAGYISVQMAKGLPIA